MRYAELYCKTNFSFLEGASHPEELVIRAAELGYAALAITDRASLAGVVRAHTAAKEAGLKLLIGAELYPVDAPPIVLWATDRAAYGRLARLLTVGRRRAPKGECELTLDDIAAHAEGLIAGVLVDTSSSISSPPPSARSFSSPPPPGLGLGAGGGGG
jgi:error-prone DNA polymerase